MQYYYALRYLLIILSTEEFLTKEVMSKCHFFLHIYA